MLTFETAHFVASALHAEEFPVLKDPQGRLLPEIALVGRSNVGKSSLLNALFKKPLAKTSSMPGKTQRILFFQVDEAAVLVDLPGYGYARAPKERISEWSQAIDRYLNERKTLRAILLLRDVRREKTPEDIALEEWAHAKRLPLLMILTKSDKLSPTELRSKQGFLFSKQDPSARRRLIDALNGFLQ